MSIDQFYFSIQLLSQSVLRAQFDWLGSTFYAIFQCSKKHHLDIKRNLFIFKSYTKSVFTNIFRTYKKTSLGFNDMICRLLIIRCKENIHLPKFRDKCQIRWPTQTKETGRSIGKIDVFYLDYRLISLLLNYHHHPLSYPTKLGKRDGICLVFGHDGTIACRNSHI